MNKGSLAVGLADLAQSTRDLTLVLAFAVVVIDLAPAVFGKSADGKVHPHGRRLAP